MTIKIIFIFSIMIACTIAGNLLLKLGAVKLSPAGGVLAQFNMHTIGGFIFFGLAFLIYAWLLRTIPLNIAQAIAAAQFITVIVASAWVLAEPIPFIRWVGILLIALGIIVVGVTSNVGPNSQATPISKDDL